MKSSRSKYWIGLDWIVSLPDTSNSSVQQFNLIYDKLMIEDLDLEVLPVVNTTISFWESYGG